MKTKNPKRKLKTQPGGSLARLVLPKQRRTLEEILDQLREMKLLGECSLEDIDQELRSSSTCIVMDKDEIKDSYKHLYLYQGKVGTVMESACGGEWYDVKVGLKRFVRESVNAAWEMPETEGFIRDARLLAGMLERAANRMERAVRQNTELRHGANATEHEH